MLIKENIKDLIFIGIGGLIYAFGINYFFIPNQMADGGLSGICIILHYLLGFDISITYFILNIPLIIIGYKFIGKKFILKSFYGTFMTSLGLKIFENYQAIMDERLVASIFGGLILGAGIGLIFLGGGSSGGSDILVKILNKYFNISVGKAFLLMDIIILSILGLLFGRDTFLYTFIGIAICTKSIDFIQEGVEQAKCFIIITDKSEEIISEIFENTGRGVTILNGKGGYTKIDKEILYCIVRNYEISSIKRSIKKIDKKVFYSIVPVNEVLGEGFKNINE